VTNNTKFFSLLAFFFAYRDTCN